MQAVELFIVFEYFEELFGKLGEIEEWHLYPTAETIYKGIIFVLEIDWFRVEDEAMDFYCPLIRVLGVIVVVEGLVSIVEEVRIVATNADLAPV